MNQLRQWKFARHHVLKIIAIMTIGSIGLFFLSAGTIAIAGLQDDIDRVDVAVVLGNTVDPDGNPSARLQARLDKTIELYRRGIFPAAIVSGGVGKEGHDEAVVMKQYLIARGMPAARIEVDSRGNNTYLTAQNTAKIMRDRQWHSTIAISQYFHLPRTKLALQRFGIETVRTAHAEFFEWRDLYSTAREVVSYASYQFRAYR